MAARDILADVQGVKLVEEQGRLQLAKQLRLFLAATTDRGSVVAADVYRLGCEEFLRMVGKTYLDQVTADDILIFQKGLRKRGIADRTIHNRHMSVMAFLRFCGLDTKKLSPRAPKYESGVPGLKCASG